MGPTLPQGTHGQAEGMAKARSEWRMSRIADRADARMRAVSHSPDVIRYSTDEFVHRLSGVQYLCCDLATTNGKSSIEDTDLNEQRCLIPIQMLMRDLVAFELDDGDERNFHPLSRRRDAGKKPVHADRVREAKNQLIDNLALPDRPRDGNDLDVRW